MFPKLRVKKSFTFQKCLVKRGRIQLNIFDFGNSLSVLRSMYALFITVFRRTEFPLTIWPFVSEFLIFESLNFSFNKSWELKILVFLALFFTNLPWIWDNLSHLFLILISLMNFCQGKLLALRHHVEDQLFFPYIILGSDILVYCFCCLHWFPLFFRCFENFK